MQRIIKFRAWDRTNKCFYPPTDDSTELYLRLDDGVVGMFGYGGFDYDESERFVLQQFTGLHDKNGKEIWEGDIVRTRLGLKVIEWDGEYVRFGIQTQPPLTTWYPLDSGTASESEVIGNIYENEDLLK